MDTDHFSTISTQLSSTKNSSMQPRNNGKGRNNAATKITSEQGKATESLEKQMTTTLQKETDKQSVKIE